MFGVWVHGENRAAMQTDKELNRIAEIRDCEIDGYRLVAFTCSLRSPATNSSFLHGRPTVAEPFLIIVLDAPGKRKEGVVTVSAANGNGPRV